MIYRLLGVLSFVVGIVFALLTLLVFLPFLSNFNGSLLILIVLFGIFAFVFLNIGWQLLHPPKIVEESPADASSVAAKGPADVRPGSTDTTGVVEDTADEGEAWAMPPDGDGAAFGTLPPGHTALEGEPLPGDDDRDHTRSVHPGGGFRKPSSAPTTEGPGGSVS